MPILTSTEIVGMFRKMPKTWHTKLLFVSIAGHSVWITNILNGKGDRNKAEKEDKNEDKNEEKTEVTM